MKSFSPAQLKRFLIQNWLILVVVLVGSWLRVAQLDTHAILFSDAGRDLLVAQQSLEQKTLPLLGIPSSVPRFKQGPISIWIEMLTISIFGVNTLAVSIVYALIGIAALIALYEYVCINVGRKEAIFAAAVLATSPLAVAHARVPYHTTPLPLALLLYLFAVSLLKKKSLFSFFLAGLSFALMFQFELAVAPLLLLIPFVIWYKKIKVSKKIILSGISGIGVGLLPQIIFDLTHNFAQLGVFVLWVGHKVLEFLTFKGGGTTTFTAYLASLDKYFTRIVSPDNSIIAILILAVMLYGSWLAISQLKQKSLAESYVVSYLAVILLLAGYLVHGSPSEAYFPPMFVLIPILLTHAAFSAHQKLQKIIFGTLIILMIVNSYFITKSNYFVSNNIQFTYGASVQEQREILSFINQKSNGNFKLDTFEGYENKFEHLFDNFKWLMLEDSIQTPTQTKINFYLENKSDPVQSSQYFYKDFESVRVYWPILY